MNHLDFTDWNGHKCGNSIKELGLPVKLISQTYSYLVKLKVSISYPASFKFAFSFITMVSLPVKIPPQILLKESAKLASACYTISTIFAIRPCIKLVSYQEMAHCTDLNLPINVQTIGPLFQVTPAQTKPKFVGIIGNLRRDKLANQGGRECYIAL